MPCRLSRRGAVLHGTIDDPLRRLGGEQLRHGRLARHAGGPAVLRPPGGPTGCRYWRKADRQRDYVRDGWNITGDVYRQDEDGFFCYECRNDDLIICGGYQERHGVRLKADTMYKQKAL